MNQYIAIREIREKLQKIMENQTDAKLSGQLKEIDEDLARFLNNDIDFKEVIDSLEDSIFITDAQGNVRYLNPAYTKNTGIAPDRVLGKNVSELIGPDKIYIGGVIPDVLATKQPLFRLSTTFGSGKPLTGFVSGTPLLDENGDLRQVIALSRPLVSLVALKEDFSKFVEHVNKIKSEQSTVEAQNNLSPQMIGKETTLKNIWTLIHHVAPSDATILITGESGAGKEVIADEIFRNSSRAGQPFIKINCAAIPAHLLESELFGYEKGAFSGASSKGKPGLFELANNGTLMLDEIGDMPMDLQVKLLRAIQYQEITRVGGSKTIKLNIRFLALTNSNLQEKVANGTFRQDLYYRLNVIPISVPPLRERKADIREFCDHFIDLFSRKYDRPFHLTEKQYNYLTQYDWPGNIREMENILEYLVLCSSGIGEIDDTVLTSLLNISMEEEPMLSNENDFNSAVAQFEKQMLERVLRNSSNLRDAGQKLNINASTISRKIKQYGIDYPGKKSD